jgi:hypothetical protein
MSTTARALFILGLAGACWLVIVGLALALVALLEWVRPV